MRGYGASFLRRLIGRSTQPALMAVLGIGLGLTAVSGAGTANANGSVPFKVGFTARGGPAPGGRCPALTVTIEGGGVATTLGQFTTAQSHCVDPNGSNPLAFTDGTYTFTNANGDQIFGSYSGILAPTATSSMDNLYLVYGNFTIEGGTGAFAGVVGGGVASGVQNLATGDVSVSLDGAISAAGAANP